MGVPLAVTKYPVHEAYHFLAQDAKVTSTTPAYSSLINKLTDSRQR